MMCFGCLGIVRAELRQNSSEFLAPRDSLERMLSDPESFLPESFSILSETEKQREQQLFVNRLRQEFGHAPWLTSDVQPIISSTFHNHGKVTLLHIVCQLGQRDIAEAIITRGANVASTDESYKTPLHWACRNGHRDVAELLLNHAPCMKFSSGQHLFMDLMIYIPNACEHNDDLTKYIDLRCAEGMTALHMASQQGHYDVVVMLIEQGASVHAVDAGHEKKVGHQVTALHLALFGSKTARTEDAKAKYNQIVSRLRAAGADDTDCESIADQLMAEALVASSISRDADLPPLHQACENGDLDAVQRLLSQGYIDVDGFALVDGFKRQTALAVLMDHGGNSSIVTELLNAGADIRVTGHRDYTPLHLAAVHGHLEAARILLNHEPKESLSEYIHLPDARGLTAIDIAKQNNHRILAGLLADSDTEDSGRFGISSNSPATAAEPTQASASGAIRSGAGWRSAVSAIQRNWRRFVWRSTGPTQAQLIEDIFAGGELPKSDGSDDIPVLHYACTSRIIVSIQKADIRQYVSCRDFANQHLVEHHSSRVLSVATKGLNIHGASISTYSDAIVLHLDQDLPLRTIDQFVDVYDNPESTSIRFERNVAEAVAFLLDKGVDIDGRCGQGFTALSQAIQNDAGAPVIKLLLDRGADILLSDSDGRNPLHWACKMGHRVAAKLLLEYAEQSMSLDQFKAYLQSVDHEGNNALHFACQLSFQDIVELLLSQHWVDINAPNGSGSTPLLAAVKSGNIDMYRLFAEHQDLRATGLPSIDGDSSQHQHRSLVDFSKTDGDGRSVFHLACASSNVKLIDLVLEQNQRLISHKRFDFWRVDNGGDVGLSLLLKGAGGVGDRIARVILDSCPEDGEFKDANGKTLVHLACEYGQVGILKLLLEKPRKHEEPTFEFVDQRCLNGLTALWYAVQFTGSEDIVTDMVDLLLGQRTR